MEEDGVDRVGFRLIVLDLPVDRDGLIEVLFPDERLGPEVLGLVVEEVLGEGRDPAEIGRRLCVIARPGPIGGELQAGQTGAGAAPGEGLELGQVFGLGLEVLAGLTTSPMAWLWTPWAWYLTRSRATKTRAAKTTTPAAIRISLCHDS